MARDVFHHIVRVLGPASCRFQVLEIGGPAVADMSNDALQTITGLAMFTGAVTAIVNPDAKRLRLRAAAGEEEARAGVAATKTPSYAARHTIDLSTLEPIIVIPPSPANTRDLKDYLGLSVQTGYLGSCASGRIEDMRAAADVLRGRKVAEGFQLHVVPTSQEIMVAAAQGRADRGARRGRRVRLVAVVRLLLRPDRHHGAGPARGLDRHAQRARPHGQPRFRDLPVQRRGDRGLGDRGQDRRPAPLPAGLKERAMAMKNLRGRVAFKFDEIDFDIDQIVGVKNIKTTNIDELSKAAMQEYDPGFAARCGRATCWSATTTSATATRTIRR